MNSKSISWLTILISAVVGVLLIAWHNETDLFNWFVRALGLVLIVPAVYVLISSLNVISPKKSGDDGEPPITFSRRSAAFSLIIVACATILFGLWMLIQPDTFIGFITYLLAVILLIFGLYQLTVVVYFARPVVLPWYFYIIPSLFVVVGLVIICTPLHDIKSTITLITGILFIVAAINAIIQKIAYASLRKQLISNDAANAGTDTKQIEENVD